MELKRKAKAGATMKQVKPPRQPIAWNKWLKHAVSLLILIVVLGGGMYVQNQNLLPITHVTVVGELSHTNKEKLVQSVSAMVSGGFINVDVAAIRAAGEKLPWVKSLQVRRVWPDTLHLIVEEQTAIASWNDDGLVNQLGEAFFPPKSTFPDGLIHLSGPEGTSQLMAQQLAQMQAKLKDLGLFISEVKMDKRHALKLVFNDGMRLNLGRSSNESRLTRFIEVFEGGLSTYQSQITAVDMRYTNGLAVEWKEGRQPDFNGTV